MVRGMKKRRGYVDWKNMDYEVFRKNRAKGRVEGGEVKEKE